MLKYIKKYDFWINTEHIVTISRKIYKGDEYKYTQMYIYIELINGKQEYISIYLKDLITSEQYDEIDKNNFNEHDIFRNMLEKKCNQMINEIINENT